MNKQANLNGAEIVYLGGKPPATRKDLLRAAQGATAPSDPTLIGHGPIRGTHEQFLHHLAATTQSASLFTYLKSSPPIQGFDQAHLAKSYEESIAIGAALVHSLDAAERKALFQDLRRHLEYENFKPPLREINRRVVAQEKA